jgi:hypothetical protein
VGIVTHFVAETTNQFWDLFWAAVDRQFCSCQRLAGESAFDSSLMSIRRRSRLGIQFARLLVEASSAQL